MKRQKKVDCWVKYKAVSDKGGVHNFFNATEVNWHGEGEEG